MKRKLLTVLLAVVMVFGVFGLTACGGSNADEDYNYYGVKYELEDVKIEAATYQGVYKMFTTPGAFLLYVDSESEGAAARFAAINDFANEYDVTIYHFNPDLAGGFAANKGSVPNILAANPASTQLKAIQDELVKVSGAKLADLKDNALWGITGADSTVSGGAVKYAGKLAATVPYAANADYAAAFACSQKVPSFGDKDADKQYVVETINTMNLFGDARLHMYNDDNGVDALTDEKTDLYVTVANYGMFEHLLLNNEGYFPVFFGGTWCPNTQAIAKATNDLAKDYGIEKIYFFDPRLDDGVRLDAVVDGAIAENKTNITGNLNTRNTDADNNWKALIKKDKDGVVTSDGQMAEYVKQAKKVLADATVTTKNAGFKDTVEAKYSAQEIELMGMEAVMTAAVAVKDTKPAGQKAGEEKTAFELVKAGYTMEGWAAAYPVTAADWSFEPVDPEHFVYTTDEREYPDTAAGEAAYEAACEAEYEAYIEAAIEEAISLSKAVLKKAGKSDVEIAAIEGDALIAAAAATDDNGTDLGKITVASIKADAEAAYKASVYNYGHLYAAFLDSYIKDADGKAYASMWNVGSALNIGSKTYTKMCVPNIMMFNGEGDGAAILVALAEAEYYYQNVSVEGNPQQIAWTNAVKAVFDANPYASYAPVMVVEEAPAAESAPAAGGSSSAGAAEAC